LIDAGVMQLDGILLTHPHADHIHGIDDVRPLVLEMRHRIDVHMDEHTSHVVRNAFSYIFQTPKGSQYPPLLNEERLNPGQICSVKGPAGALHAMPFTLRHGEIDALGFRFGNLAYTPDVIDIPEQSLPHLENLDVWIIDALRYKKHPSHFSLEEALAWIERMKPRRAILTNLHNDLDYHTLLRQLPLNVTAAYDGMSIETAFV